MPLKARLGEQSLIGSCQVCGDIHGNYLGDYGSKTIDGIRIFYLSGAWSSDQWLRTEGVNWWRDEELDVAELEAAVELYAKIKPQIVLTHDGPDEAVRALLAHGSAHKEINRTGTGNALNAMLEAHRPRKWIFGHWHTRFRKKIGGTEFRCLPELGWCRIQGFEKREVAANAIGRGRSRHDVIRSSGNVFADMGLPDAAELGARARLESEEHFKPRSEEELERNMKLARRIMRDNRKALRALADAPPADDEPL